MSGDNCSRLAVQNHANMGAYLRQDGMIVMSEGETQTEVLHSSEIKIPGKT